MVHDMIVHAGRTGELERLESRLLGRVLYHRGRAEALEAATPADEDDALDALDEWVDHAAQHERCARVLGRVRARVGS